MFGKDAKSVDAKLETVLGVETHFQGTIRSKGSIRVDGHVEGGISAEGVIVGESGQVQGDMTAKTVIIGGKVTGNIVAAESLELQPRSQVFGDIRTSQLGIAEGAVFEGNCVMTTEKTKVIEMDEVMKKASPHP
ncbi:MAG TPA: polymer-forming cytoskeletal protein [Elusimicrobiota bacterium]|nr:polymer-forming cytoskeletal protein [Elusimicrobiota bacterium]